MRDYLRCFTENGSNSMLDGSPKGWEVCGSTSCCGYSTPVASKSIAHENCTFFWCFEDREFGRGVGDIADANTTPSRFWTEGPGRLIDLPTTSRRQYHLPCTLAHLSGLEPVAQSCNTAPSSVWRPTRRITKKPGVSKYRSELVFRAERALLRHWLSPRQLPLDASLPPWRYVPRHLVLYDMLSLGPLFGFAPPSIFVVPDGTELTSGLAGAWRVLAIPAFGWSAVRGFVLQGGGPDQVLCLLCLGATVGVVSPTALPVLFGAGFTFGLAGNRRIGAVLALARFLGNSYLLPAELPPVLLPFGGFASDSLVLPALFGRLLGIRGTGPFDRGGSGGFRKVGRGVGSCGFPGTTPVCGFQEYGS